MNIIATIAIILDILCLNSLAYKAAVLEHYPLSGTTPEETISVNLNEYATFASSAKKQQADILVFPEYGLTQFVQENVDAFAVEIDSENDVIKKLKNISVENEVYLVVNLLEKKLDSDKIHYYNTDLVFDRRGAIILTYRKINLFKEPKLSPGDVQQTLSFTTDFGVTFGIFTGFDIYFDNPSRRVFDNANVTDVIYTTAWVSVMPFYTSLSLQHGYASANGVNLLAANYGKPKEGYGGSGVYGPDGKPIQIYISDSPSSKPIVVNVTQMQKREDRSFCAKMKPFGLPGDFDRNNITNFNVSKMDLSKFKFKRIDLTPKKISDTICHGQFCCNFDITVDSIGNFNTYFMVAFDGWDAENHHFRICSLLACENGYRNSCGKRFDANTTFTRLTVRGELKREKGTFYTPVTVDSYLLPFSETTFCSRNITKEIHSVELSTLGVQKNVLVFGLLGFISKPAYRAAVIEYKPEMRSTPNDTIKTNLRNLATQLDSVQKQLIDIAIFPEYALTTFVTDPEEYAVEIHDNHHIIRELSSLAAERNLYLLVNLLEKVQTYSNTSFYNTNLVFNRNGTIILKYRKINLYGEPHLTPGEKDQNSTFTADFGVTFGTFTCFDILFKNPSRTILERYNVTDILFPTAWISKFPFYNSLSVQHGYAKSTGVNILAANYADPGKGAGGSGIFLGDGRIASFYIGTDTNRAVVQDVEKITKRENSLCSNQVSFSYPEDLLTQNNLTEYKIGKSFSASRYQFKAINLTKTTQTQVCDRDFCCNFDIVMGSNKSLDVYKVLAFDGMVTFNSTEARIRICSLVLCEDDSNESCGARFNSSTSFEKITIAGNLPNDETSFYYPIGLKFDLLPLEATSYCANESPYVNFTTLKAQSGLLAFGIFGRTDQVLDGNNASSSLTLSWFIIISMVTKYVIL